MGWGWQPIDLSIHVYFQVLWDNNYKTKYQNICEHFLAPLYEFIFCTHAPCMIDKAIVVIKIFINWYLMEHGTYIRVYRSIKSCNLLPQFIQDRLVLQEVAYQTIIHGVGGILYRDKKGIWHPLQLYIGICSFSNTKQSHEEVDILLSYHFWEKRFKRYDPKRVINEHFNNIDLSWEYTSKIWEEEDVHCEAITYNEILFKR
jgi:hypothetical protein